jgi:hypothetical protein
MLTCTREICPGAGWESRTPICGEHTLLPLTRPSAAERSILDGFLRRICLALKSLSACNPSRRRRGVTLQQSQMFSVPSPQLRFPPSPPRTHLGMRRRFCADSVEKVRSAATMGAGAKQRFKDSGYLESSLLMVRDARLVVSRDLGLRTFSTESARSGQSDCQRSINNGIESLWSGIR